MPEELAAVDTYFRDDIARGILPGKDRLAAAQAGFVILQKRTWRNIYHHIRNIIKATMLKRLVNCQ
jgi:hypothetical protein